MPNEKYQPLTDEVEVSPPTTSSGSGYVPVKADEEETPVAAPLESERRILPQAPAVPLAVAVATSPGDVSVDVPLASGVFMSAPPQRQQELVLVEDHAFVVRVLEVDGAEFTLSLPSGRGGAVTLSELREIIAAQSAVPASLQRLIFRVRCFVSFVCLVRGFRPDAYKM